MALLSKFLFTAKMVLSFYIAAIATNQNQFVYLNMPETLTKPGIVHKNNLQKTLKRDTLFILKIAQILLKVLHSRDNTMLRTLGSLLAQTIDQNIQEQGLFIIS